MFFTVHLRDFDGFCAYLSQQNGLAVENSRPLAGLSTKKPKNKQKRGLTSAQLYGIIIHAPSCVKRNTFTDKAMRKDEWELWRKT